MGLQVILGFYMDQKVVTDALVRVSEHIDAICICVCNLHEGWEGSHLLT